MPDTPQSIIDAAAHLRATPYDWRETPKDMRLVCRSCQCSASFIVVIDEGKARAVQCSVCLKAFMLRQEA